MDYSSCYPSISLDFDKYPYSVIYEDKGDALEKSRLLAFLLNELGFGTVLFEYKQEGHTAVGIKCQPQYSVKNTGYCFIETTSPSIICDDQGTYVGYKDKPITFKLESTPTIINLYDGISFDASEEYNDAKELNRLNQAGDISGYLSPSDYDKWKRLVDKYEIPTTIP